MTPEDLAQLSFLAERMGPNVDAVCRFVTESGHCAAIGSLDHLGAVVRRLSRRAGEIRHRRADSRDSKHSHVTEADPKETP